MGNSLPWSLVFAGVAIAIVVEILQIPVLPFAVGLYLPIYLSTPIMVGGLVRLYVDKKKVLQKKSVRLRLIREYFIHQVLLPVKDWLVSF